MKYFTISNAARKIGVSRMTIYNWIKSNKIDFIKVEGSRNNNSYAIPETAIKERGLLKKKDITKMAIERVFNEYGDVLDQLADE